jgi:phosphopantetheinyl transferase
MTELWLVDLERAAPALQVLESAEPRLSSDDRARARQFTDPRQRRDRLTAYIALRIVLERMVGGRVRGAAFVRSPVGKPRLADGSAAFSLSHSDGLALIGVTRAGEIGVDLERARSVRASAHHQRLIIAAGRGLAAVPLPAQNVGEPPRQAAFLQAWSRLEAFAKARGRGLARLLADVGVRGRHSGSGASTPARVEAAARRIVEEAGVKAHDLQLPAGLHGAVALGQSTRAPRVRAFPVDRPAIIRLLVPRAARGRGR